MSITLLLILGTLFALYLFMKKHLKYWKESGVPIVSITNLAFGTTFDYLRGRRSLEELNEAVYNSKPDAPYIVSHIVLFKPVLFIRDPEIVYRITVKDFSYFPLRQPLLNGGGRLVYRVAMLRGEEWKTVRNKLLTAFSSIKLKGMYKLIEESSEMLAEEHFRPFAKTGEPMDVKGTMVKFSLDVIGKCAFGMQFNTLNDSQTVHHWVMKTLSDPGFMNSFRLFIQFACPRALKFLGLKLTSDEVENFFFNLLHGAEESRRNESTHRGDVLQLMLDIKNESGNKAHHFFTENHVASNMFILYQAGFETTSITLTFALFEIALWPEVQEKLRHKIKTAREANNGVLDYNTIKNIAYLDMVISETLRLHSPPPFNTRICTEAYQLPGSSVVVRPNDIVVYSVSGIHKDEKYFPDPLKFDPERFSEENVARMKPCTFMPFGSGPRICLGERFARMMIKICLAAIFSRFRLSRCSKTEVPAHLKKGGFFHSPKNKIWLSVEEL